MKQLNNARLNLAAAFTLALVVIGHSVMTTKTASGQALEVINSESQVLMHVAEGGNVGIGTTSPIAPLHIGAGSLFFEDSLGDVWFRETADLSAFVQSAEAPAPSSPAFRVFAPPYGDAGLLMTALTNGNVGIGTPNPTAKLDVVGDIRVSGLVDGVDVSALETQVTNRISSFTQFSGLNRGSIILDASAAKLNTGTHTFTKAHDDSRVEVTVNSRFRVDSLISSQGVLFDVRIDDASANVSNRGSIETENGTEFVSIYAIFDNLQAGTHTVSIWGEPAQNGRATGVMADPGGWGGAIIVKETW